MDVCVCVTDCSDSSVRMSCSFVFSVRLAVYVTFTSTSVVCLCKCSPTFLYACVCERMCKSVYFMVCFYFGCDFALLFSFESA